MSNAKTFSFSDVGDRLPTLREHEKIRRDTPRVNFGPSLPLRLSNKKSQLFRMNENLGSQVADNLKNLILTNRGERVMMPDFGANLKPIMSEFGSPTFEQEAMARISTAVRKFLPFVSLTSMQLEEIPAPANSGLKIVKIGITYSVSQGSLSNQQITVTISTVG